jgi:hypothetical protein
MTQAPLETDELPEYERVAPRRRGGCGCWVTGIVTLLVVALLVGVGLLLPPVNLGERLFGPQYTPITTDAASVSVEGLTVSAPGAVSADYGVAIDAAPEELTPTLPGRTLAGSVYALAERGTPPESLRLTLQIPDSAQSDRLDLFGWAQGAAPQLIPAAGHGDQVVAEVDMLPRYVALFNAQPQAEPVVLAAVDVTQTLSPEVASAASIIAPAGLQPTLTGSLTGSLAAGFDLSADYRVMPAVRNYADPRATDPETVTALLSNNGLRAEHAAQLAAFAASAYDGVLIDYRDLPVEVRALFSDFVAAVRSNLTGTGKQVIVAVPAPEAGPDGALDTGAYDWATLGAAADYIQIRLPDDPAAYGPNGLAQQIAAYAVGQIPREKVLLTLPARSTRQDGSSFAPIGYEQALSALGDVVIEADATDDGIIRPGQPFTARLDGYAAETSRDETTGEIYIDYLDENGAAVSRMWLMTAPALSARLAQFAPLALGGVAFDDLQAEDLSPDLLPLLRTFKLGVPASANSGELALRWSVESASGVVDVVETGLDEPLRATIEAPEGNYAINVAVAQGSEPATVRGGAAVAVFVPSPTPTQTPTPEPTPTPLATNTPEQPSVQIVATAVSVAAPPAAAPGAGSIVGGGFEYGGHVTGTGTGAAGLMSHAGMNWMKIQLRYGPGMDGSVAQQAINEAHGRGFKILLGVVGSPEDLRNGGTGYMQEFASFLGSVASYGPDAIEVWNEPNLDREWPDGQISGSLYAQMLQMAYNAIKGANGSVMVISGAPAPTGAEGAYPGRVMNDDRWVSELLAAGGAQWMDCLGAHYNEGIVGPSQAGGDPRDNYYTRYFPTTLNTYWNLIGGQRPICFTELGYLTPEGFPPLPSYFSWAQNVTLGQQAAWLAEAAAIASQSGRVRLMIIWNVDFTDYGTDPMGGYAIVRPNGSCPACDALAAAR